MPLKSSNETVYWGDSFCDWRKKSNAEVIWRINAFQGLCWKTSLSTDGK